jgi:hypothetical protein
MCQWMIEGQLARGSRPGFTPQQIAVSTSTVRRWIDEAKADFQIRSIICLLSEKQLGLYDGLPGGLLAHYRRMGFEVEHIPVRTGQPLSQRQKARLWSAYGRLKKPVLIHCSAGYGRSKKASTYIAKRLDQERD